MIISLPNHFFKLKLNLPRGDADGRRSGTYYTFFTFKVADIVADAVKPHLRQINVGMYSDTTNGHKLADFHRRLDIELMRGIFENVQNVPVVGTFGSRRQSERARRWFHAAYAFLQAKQARLFGVP